MKVNTTKNYPFKADFYSAKLVANDNGTGNSIVYTFVATVKCMVSGRGAIGTIDLTAEDVFPAGSQFQNIRDINGMYVYPLNLGGQTYVVKYVEPILNVFSEIDGYKHTLQVA